MSGALNDIVDDWIHWLNRILAHPNLPLYVSRSPNDAGNEDDPSITKAALHVRSSTARNTPAMIGLVSLSAHDDDDDEVLGQELFEEQIRPLRSSAPFLCFVAHGASLITFYACEVGSSGRDARSKKLVITAPLRSLERGGNEQDSVLTTI